MTTIQGEIGIGHNGAPDDKIELVAFGKSMGENIWKSWSTVKRLELRIPNTLPTREVLEPFLEQAIPQS